MPGASWIDWRVRLDTVLRDRVAARVSERRARSHLLAGPDGIGKSTLLRAVGERLEELGHPVIPIVGDAALRGVPLAALAPILAAGDARTTAERLQRLYDAIAPVRSRHVLLVDDAHLLDPESGAVVIRLVRGYGIRAVLAAPSAAALGDEIARLVEDGTVAHTRLPPLDAASAAMAVETALGGRVHPDDLRSLVARSGGNPLHLRELVAGILREGSWRQTRGGLRLRTGPLPARLRRTVAGRYDGLEPPARHLAELLAAAGSLAHPDEPGDVEAADALESAGLAERTDGRLRLAEPLHGEVLLGLLSSAARGRRRAEAGGRLLASGDPGDRYRGIVVLAESADPPTPAELEWAAREAHAREEYARTVELVERLARGRGTASHEALALRADALSMLGRHEEAETAFEEVLAVATEDAVIARAASQLGFHHAMRRLDMVRAVAAATPHRARLTDPEAIAYLDANLAKFRFIAGDEAAAPAPAPGLEGAQEASAQLLRVLRTVFTGELDVARAAIERTRELAAAHETIPPHVGAAADFGEFVVLVDEVRGGDAECHVLEVRARRDDESRGMWAYALGLLALLRGDADGAHTAASEAVELLAWRDSIAALGTARALRATAAAAGGRTAAAREALESIDERNRASNVPTDLQAAEAEAWLLAADGDRDAAAETIGAAAERGLAAGYPTFSSLTALTAIRLDRPEAVSGPLRSARRLAGGVPVVRLAADYADALVARDPTGLLAAVAAFEAGRFTATAADAARQAAEVARAQGAVSLARRAASAAARLGRRGPTDAVSALSARELAIAQAAAARLRNREIAERFDLSVRTVENHLASAYRKLGVASRDELRGVLG